MTDVKTTPPLETRERPDRSHLPLTHAVLPRWAPGLVAVLAAAASGILTMTLGWDLVAFAVVGVALYAFGLPFWSLQVEEDHAAFSEGILPDKVSLPPVQQRACVGCGRRSRTTPAQQGLA